MKNESGTQEFPCSSVGDTPSWGKGQKVKKKKKKKLCMYVCIYIYILYIYTYIYTKTITGNPFSASLIYGIFM